MALPPSLSEFTVVKLSDRLGALGNKEVGITVVGGIAHGLKSVASTRKLLAAANASALALAANLPVGVDWSVAEGRIPLNPASGRGASYPRDEMSRLNSSICFCRSMMLLPSASPIVFIAPMMLLHAAAVLESNCKPPEFPGSVAWRSAWPGRSRLGA